MFDITPAQAAEYRQKMIDEAQRHVGGEQVIAAALFRRGGSAAGMVASKAQLGAAVYAGIKLFNKKRAGGLPERVILAVTPTKLYAYSWAFKHRDYKIQEEVAVWERAGLKISTDVHMGMTALTIESPAEGEKATLVGGSVKDDPVSQEVIEVLRSGGTAAVAV